MMKLGDIIRYRPAPGDRSHGRAETVVALVTHLDQTGGTMNLCAFGHDGVPYSVIGLPIPAEESENAGSVGSPEARDVRGGRGKGKSRNTEEGG